MKVSILICSFSGSDYLHKTLESIANTFPKDKYDMEILVGCEKERTGLANTANRYMDLFNKSTGDIIVKSDDDVIYFDGWFDYCYDVIMNDNKVGYCGTISMRRMRKEGIRLSYSDRLPILPDGYNYESTISGACWVFKRELWVNYPYNTIKEWRLDGHYGGYIKRAGLEPAALNGGMTKHIGRNRYKGIPTDIPGKLPSQKFIKDNSITLKLN